MKNLKEFLMVVFCLSLCFACSDLGDDPINDLKSGKLGASKDGESKMVTVPFKSAFVGTYTYGKFGETNPNPKCPINVVVDGIGTGTHVGNSTVYFDFCVNPIFEGENFIRGEYGNSYSYIVAANGDTLFVSSEGAVLPGRLDDHPEYVVSYWRDPFIISGGTGRFEGATGSGISDDYNSSEDDNSHHHWEGTITMVKGKR
jgi:hypothetical protein